MLKRVKPTRVSDLVFEQLRDLIFKGRLKPGDQLMTERELTESLGVSRPTVREAINRLVALGLLEHRQGQGTFVNPTAFSSDRNPFSAIVKDQEVSLIDLLEVRLGLECNAVMMAANRATDEDILDLERSIEEITAEIERGGLGQEPDVAFHMGIAYATKNPAHIRIMKNFYELLFFGISTNLQHLYSEPANLKKVTEQHRKILDCIRTHDPQAAYEAMREHITFVLDFFRHI
ncbi:MAG: FadR family transcriptional regulator [Desulfobacteraceae bacterium]|nr:FadR family transcriptional regulator [Desulfobacteraceae bacterium]